MFGRGVIRTEIKKPGGGVDWTFRIESGKRFARLSFNTACELGFRGSLDEWNRLVGAVARR
jgi:hypothetical protein